MKPTPITVLAAVYTDLPDRRAADALSAYRKPYIEAVKAALGADEPRFSVGDTVIVDSPHTRGIPGAERARANFRGFHGEDKAVVVFDGGIQSVVDAAWLEPVPYKRHREDSRYGRSWRMARRKPGRCQTRVPPSRPFCDTIVQSVAPVGDRLWRGTKPTYPCGMGGAGSSRLTGHSALRRFLQQRSRLETCWKRAAYWTSRMARTSPFTAGTHREQSVRPDWCPVRLHRPQAQPISTRRQPVRTI